MKKHLILILFLLPYTLVHSQYVDTKGSTEKFGFIHETNQHYDECTARTFIYGDSINLVISPKVTEDTPFQLYITLKNHKEALPEGFYSYNKQESAHTLSASFIRMYKDWGNTYRPYHVRQAQLYIQPFAGNYLVSGKVQLDTESEEHIEFMHYGPVTEENIEVQGILIFDPANYLYNKGEILWQDNTISTPCAFRMSKDGKLRISIIDKILFQDKKLDYGVSFDFEANNVLPSGEFKSDDTSNPVKAIFFNQGKMMYPENTQLFIKYNSKKGEYTLNYQLDFPDNQILKGSYKGKIPQDDF